jgi:hypothetical protein
VLKQSYSSQLPRNARQGIMRSVLDGPKSRITRYPSFENPVPSGILTFRIANVCPGKNACSIADSNADYR